jgi:hypothetical protein
MEVNSEMTNNKGRPSMKIYFVPFEIETYVPITMNDIESKSKYEIWFYGEHAFCNKIQRLLESNKTNAKIDNKVIRLKVEIFKNEGIIAYYVDQEGVVVKNKEETFYLSKDKLKTIEKEILYFSGVVDIKTSRKLFQ